MGGRDSATQCLNIYTFLYKMHIYNWIRPVFFPSLGKYITRDKGLLLKIVRETVAQIFLSGSVKEYASNSAKGRLSIYLWSTSHTFLIKQTTGRCTKDTLWIHIVIPTPTKSRAWMPAAAASRFFLPVDQDMWMWQNLAFLHDVVSWVVCVCFFP